MNGELDDLISYYVRVSAADYRGYLRCYTCPVIVRWQDADAGHWIPRGNLATRYDLNNLRVQCRTCNRQHGGCPEIFEEELRDEIGDEIVDEMLATKYLTFTPAPDWENGLIIHYKAKNAALSVVK